jgi:hypothetical protein
VTIVEPRPSWVRLDGPGLDTLCLSDLHSVSCEQALRELEEHERLRLGDVEERRCADFDADQHETRIVRSAMTRVAGASW